jgi:hypothetical protein
MSESEGVEEVLRQSGVPTPWRDGPGARPRWTYDAKRLADFAGRIQHEVDEQWLIDRSPLEIPAQQGVEVAERFLRAIFGEDERVLLFLEPWSQGDFLFTPEGGVVRLGLRPDVDDQVATMPEQGVEGVWYLAQPIEGTWRSNGAARLGRRHSACVTDFRHLLLRPASGVPVGLWLKALVQVPVPVVAVVTDGAGSAEALVNVAAGSKAAWDALRDDLVPPLAVLGSDPAAMVAVPLARLPGCRREGDRSDGGAYKAFERPQLQKLVYLNHPAGLRPILDVKI